MEGMAANDIWRRALIGKQSRTALPRNDAMQGFIIEH